MLSDNLRFIVGAVARKDYVPELCHLLIRDGRAVAYDGLLSMSTPIEIDLHVKPHAKDLMQAVKAAGDEKTIALNLTPAGRLSFKAGKFKVFIPCLDNEGTMQLPLPEGDEVVITDDLFDSIKELAPFMAVDASRPWAMGIRIKSNSTYATNNIILVERWHGSDFKKEIIIPADAVKEILRIGIRPSKVQMNNNSITFWYGEDRWLRSNLIDGEWPDNLDKIFKQNSTPKEFPTGFFDGLETLRPFIDERGRVYLTDGKLSTSDTAGIGASVEIEPNGEPGVFHLMQLKLLEGAANTIDFSTYPKPCPFYGKKLRGVIVGLRA